MRGSMATAAPARAFLYFPAASDASCARSASSAAHSFNRLRKLLLSGLLHAGVDRENQCGAAHRLRVAYRAPRTRQRIYLDLRDTVLAAQVLLEFALQPCLAYAVAPAVAAGAELLQLVLAYLAHISHDRAGKRPVRVAPVRFFFDNHSGQVHSMLGDLNDDVGSRVLQKASRLIRNAVLALGLTCNLGLYLLASHAE